jgi:hypothetical protein
MVDEPTEYTPSNTPNVREGQNPRIELVSAVGVGGRTMIADEVVDLSGLTVSVVSGVAYGAMLIAAVMSGISAATWAGV